MNDNNAGGSDMWLQSTKVAIEKVQVATLSAVCWIRSFAYAVINALPHSLILILLNKSIVATLIILFHHAIPALPYNSNISSTKHTFTLKMGRLEFLRMKTDEDGPTSDSINSDMNDLKNAAKQLINDAKQLINDATRLGGLGFGTSFLKWVASFAAIYLLILDRTNWRTNMLTSLLVPYIFFSLPWVLFNFLRGEVGKWIAFIAVVLRLFFPRHFPEWLEFPGSLILLLVVAPDFFAHTLKGSWVGVVICLLIGCYLLQEHIRASGGFRNSFTHTHGISNTLGIIILIVYPIWALVLHFF